MKELLSDHLKAAKALVKDQTILEHLEAQIQKDCMKLRSFLQAAEVIYITEEFYSQGMG